MMLEWNILTMPCSLIFVRELAILMLTDFMMNLVIYRSRLSWFKHAYMPSKLMIELIIRIWNSIGLFSWINLGLVTTPDLCGLCAQRSDYWWLIFDNKEGLEALTDIWWRREFPWVGKGNLKPQLIFGAVGSSHE